MTVRIFLHGLDSSPGGTKSRFFRALFPDMLTPAFTGDLGERMKVLQEVLSGERDIRMVGSSFGGLMATLYTMDFESRIHRLILLAPAIHILKGTDQSQRRISVPTHIYHGTGDEVIPLQDVEEVAHQVFTHLQFHVVKDDHFLHSTFSSLDWQDLLA